MSAHLMPAILNTCIDFFMKKIVTQSRLVLEFNSTPRLYHLGRAHQEKPSIVFWLTTKPKSLDFNIITLNLHYPSII